MKELSIKKQSISLRKKAEDHLNSLKSNRVIHEINLLKMVHELEVHQIELEMQNEELTLAKEKAEIAELKYTELYQFAPLGYITLSKEGLIEELNLSAAQILENRCPDFRHRMFVFFLAENSRGIFCDFLNHVFDDQQLNETCELQLLSKSNSLVYVNVVGTLSRCKKDCHLTLVDITERKQKNLIISQQQNELKKLLHDKDRFISIIGHDLRSPFTSLVGLSGILINKLSEFDLAKIEKYAIQINKSAKNTLELLEDILIWVKSQSGKLSFKSETRSLSHVCMDVFTSLKYISNNKDLIVRYQEDQHIDISTDLDILSLILQNIITNAIKYSRYGSEIYVYAKKTSENVIITVSDKGIGMSPETQAALFDITEIYSRPGTANETGTGLGLILCKELIEKHGGRIWIESELGNGCDVRFTIPQH